MSHYAKIINTKVTEVIVATEDFIKTKVEDKGYWVQTSYNTRGGVHYDQAGKPSADQSKALRKNYAGRGYTYNQDRDAFIPPKPYPSWILNETSCLWGAPVAMPTDDKMYSWDEANQNWVEVEAVAA